MFDHSFPAPPALFVFFKVDISWHTQTPLSGPGLVHKVLYTEMKARMQKEETDFCFFVIRQVYLTHRSN